MKYITQSLLIGCCLVGVSSAASAHFDLVEPKPAQSGAGGGKGGPPCPRGTATNMITEVKGGSMLAIKINETVYHPGHYRIALAATLDGIPKDPEVMKKPNGDSISAVIDPAPMMPVLADGALKHTAKFAGMQMLEVKLPDIDCPKCTLQVAEFMADHGAPYYYHQCATLKITASGGGTPDAGTPDTATGTGGTPGTGDAGTGTGGTPGTGGASSGTGGSVATGGTTGSGGTVATGGTSGSSTGGTKATGGTSGSTGGSSGSSTDDGGGSSGGCSVGGGSPSGAAFGVLALLGLLIRRRRR